MESATNSRWLILPGVALGPNATIGAYVVLGEPVRGFAGGEMPTVIGAGSVIRSHTVIYAGNVIGERFQSGHGVLIREMNEIGDNVSIGTHSIIEHHVKIGHGVRIHSNAFIPEYSIIEDGAWIGPCVTFTNALYPQSAGVKSRLSGPHVLARAKIGANATLLPGITIGRNALVGAGSVVLRDVPDGKVVAGNPARIIRDVQDIPAYSSNPTELD